MSKEKFPYQNLRLKQYDKLTKIEKERVDILIPYIKPNSRIIIKQTLNKRKKILPSPKHLFHLTLGEYLEFTAESPDGNFLNCQTPNYIFKKLYRLTPKQIINLNYYNVVSVSKWINSELMLVQNKEQEAFDYKEDMKLQKAGIKRLEIFGNYNLISQLSNNDILREEKVLEIPYIRCLQWITKQRIDREIQDDIIKQQTKKP